MRESVFAAVRAPLMRGLLGLLVAGLGILASSRHAVAQPPAGDAPLVEYRVPRDRLAEWLRRGEWHAASREEYDAFRRLSASTRTGPPRVSLASAEYAATFAGDTLRSGTLTAEVAYTGTAPELLTLDPLNVALEELAWSDREAVWGNLPAGETVLLVARPGTLHGRWNLKGRRLARGVEFDLHVAPATVTRFLLTVPRDHTVTVSSGTARLVGPADDPNWAVWKVDLGSRTSCRLLMTRQAEGPEPQPLILAEHDVSCVVRREGVQFQIETEIEVLEAAVRQLTFTLPKTAEIYSVALGSEATLAWQIVADDDAQRLLVDLPEPLLGRSRPIRLQGLMRLDGDAGRLPQVRLQGAAFLGGETHLKVEPIVQLRSLHLDGFRQTGMIANPVEGETLTFAQYRDDGAIAITFGRPDLNLSAYVLSHLRIEPRAWQFRGQIDWTARSGSTFVVTVGIGREWIIRDVVGSTDANGSRVSNWRVDGTGDDRTLRIEFLDALAPDHPKSLRIAAERIGSHDGRESLPILAPQACESCESLIVVSHPPERPPLLAAARGCEEIEAAAVPESYQKMDLWKEVGTAAGTQMLVRARATQSATGTLIFENDAPPFSATAWTTFATTGGAHVREHVRIDIVPAAAPLDRLHVFVNPPAETEWTWQTDDGRIVAAREVSEAAYPEWALPADGQLWEIRLPEATVEPVRLIAERTRTWSTHEIPSLVFVPAAELFEGVVEFRHPERSIFDVQAEGPVAATEDELAVVPLGRAPSDGGRQKFWHYFGPADRLEFRTDVPDDSAEPPAARLVLQSLMHSGRAGYDLHRARYELVSRNARGSFRFVLPPPAVLVATRVDGQLVTATRAGDEFVLPSETAARTGQIEIEYRVPSIVGAFRERRDVPLPQCDVVLVGTVWEFALPPGSRLAGAPDEMVLAAPLPTRPWTERFFGPLGRGHQSLFNPFEQRDWQALWRNERPQPATAARSELVAPAGWSVYRAEAPHRLDTLRLESWHRTRLNLLAWVVLLATLLISLLLRKYRVHWRGRYAAVWVALCFVAAWVAPDAVAEVVGGLFAGTVIAALFPRGLLIRPRPARAARDTVPVGSTASFRHSSVSATLLLVLLANAGHGQQVPPASENQNGAVVAGAFPSRAVLIPVAESDAQPQSQQVVYLSRSVAEQVARSRQRAAQSASEYLMAAARYVGRVDAQRSVELEAQYRIAVLTPNGRASVRLPLSNANLGGDDICRVNGRPHPVLPAPDGLGYVLELAPASEPGEGPAVAERPGSHPDVVWYDVVLRLNPSTSGAGSFEMQIPPVAASRLELTFEGAVPAADVRTARGKVVSDAQARRLSAELGRTDRLSVTWTAAAETAAVAAALEARVVTLAEVRPSWLQLRMRSEYHVVRGSVNFVEWQLPRQAVVRRVEADSLLGATKLLSPRPDASRLLIEFSTPMTEDFVVEALIELPVTARRDTVTIPPLALHEESAGVRVLMRQLGVSCPSEFHLTPVETEAAALRGISTDSIPKSFSAIGGSRKPDLAWQLEKPVPIACHLELVMPVRRVRQLHEVRIERGRLDWLMNAEIQTSTAPVFRHTLRVDPRLKIESISIEEDEAERLVRWQRTGERVELLLSDRTTGTQDLTFRGSMPLEPSGEIDLPEVTVEAAEIVESDLLISADRDIAADVVERAGLTVAESAAEPAPPFERQTFIVRLRGVRGERAPRLRFAPRSEQLVVESAHRLSATDAGEKRLVSDFRLSGSERLRRNVTIRIPAALAESMTLELPEGAIRSDVPRADGGIDVRLSTSAPARPPAALTVVLSPAGDLDDAAGLPLPNVVDATGGDAWLLLPRSSPLRPADAAVRATAPELLPSWMAEMAAPDEREHYTAYQLAARGAEPVRLVRPAEPGPAIPLVYHRVWLNASGVEHGLSEFRLRPGSTPRLQIEYPQDLTVQCAVIEGRAAESASSTDEPLLTLDVPAGASRITVHWSRQGPAPGIAERRSLRFPQARGIAAGETLVAAVSVAGTTTTQPTLMQVLNLTEHRLSLFEAVLTASRVDVAAGVNPPTDWGEIVRLRNVLRNQYRRDEPSPSDDEIVRKLRDRYTTAMAEFETLAAAVQDATESGEALIAAAPSPVGDRAWNAMDPRGSDIVYGRLVPEGPGLIYRPLPEGLISLALAVLAFIVLVPVLRRFIRLETGDWLQTHRPVAWCLLGLVWWICLRPSAIGLVLFLVAGVVAVRRRLQETRQSEVYI